MEGLLLSLENLKQQLICSFCNNMVCDSYKFISCSHIFCYQHLKNTRMSKCFLCHKGDVQDVIQDNDSNQMVEEYKHLIELFNNMKEHIDTASTTDFLPSSKTQGVEHDKNEKIHVGHVKNESLPSKGETDRILRKKEKVTSLQEISNKLPTNNAFVKSDAKIEITKSCNARANAKKFTKSVSPESVLKRQTVNSIQQNMANSKSSMKTSECEKTEKIMIPKTESSTKHSFCSNESFLDVSGIISGKSTMKRNKKGETPLHSACVQNKVEDVKRLLEQGISPNSKDNAGWTPLHEAVASGHQILVELLLNHGAFPQVPGPHYETPLHEAVRLGVKDIAKLLILAGASVHAKNDKGETPLSIASKDMLNIIQSEKNQSNSIKNLNISFDIQNDNHFVILPLALNKQNSTKLQRLTKKHANLKSVTEFSKSATHVMVDSDGENCPLTQETLLAVVNSKPIISSGWLAASSETSLADAAKFYITNLGGATECVHLSLMNKLYLLPGLFAGCHFYFIGFNSKYEISARLTIKKQFLCQLVTDGGGVVLRREPNPESIPENECVSPYHAAPGSPLENCAHYIIYQNRPALAYNMKHIKSLPVAWLIECVQNFKLVDP